MTKQDKLKTISWICLVLCFHLPVLVLAGCRPQDVQCDPVCVFNETTQQQECNLRAALIFTNSSEFEASLEKMTVVWDLSLKKIQEMKLLPDYLQISSNFYDDRCDQSMAMISAMDGHTKDCADVIFGPVCDYALGKFIGHFLLAPPRPT